MLQIKDIRKEYITGSLKQTALDGVSLNFRSNEFVAILGPSGSGKTTLLNIIGGLDRYDSGDLVINGISTRKYKDRDWDSYRNHTIGFVFQSYNLIPHQSILSNVELALTISGISRSKRRKKAKEALERVGLGDQIHKRPNQMSGGQMQRVAIARALVNDPDILLADEPTGALDSETSLQVMDMLAEVAKDRLVIMVTHNPELAEQYATRIVKLRDGKITDDSDPLESDEEEKEAVHKSMGKSSMSRLTSLGLSFNNLRTKKGRTILTSFAGSIGIIGIALILSLSNGVNKYIDDIQRETMTSYPISIEAQAYDISSYISASKNDDDNVDHEMDGVYIDNSDLERRAERMSSMTENNLTAFKKYLDDESSPIHEYIGENGIVYSYDTKFGMYTYDDNGRFVNTDGSTLRDVVSPNSQNSYRMTRMISSSPECSQLIPDKDGAQVGFAIENNYDVVYGKYPEKYDELVLVMDENNEISASTLYKLGILPTEDYKTLIEQISNGEDVVIKQKKLDYEDICAKEYWLVPQCDMYIKKGNGYYEDISANNTRLEGVAGNGIKMKIVGIIKPNGKSKIDLIESSIGYTKALTDHLIEYTDKSEVVIAQKANKDFNVVTGLRFNADTDEEKIRDAKTYISNMNISEKAEVFTTIVKNMQNEQESELGGDADMPEVDLSQMSETEMASAVDKFLQFPDDTIMLTIYDRYISSGDYDDMLSTMGVVSLDTPSSIDIYADSFEDKDSIADCINDYNKTVSEEDKITYTDYVGLLMSSVTTIVKVITYVLIAFVAVSLVVSSIMIGIITYISVLERTKEIGILRAMGASKKNISQVFNAETFIIGLFAGLIGIGVTLVLLIPGNIIIHSLTDNNNVNASLPLFSGGVLVLLSIVLTLIGGFIPSKKAAKKDPVTALRTE